MVEKQRFDFGDQLRHLKRPEWGNGTVIKTEDTSINGQPTQRLSVRFANVGLKRIVTGQVELEKVEETTAASDAEPAGSRLEAWDRMEDSGWLGPLARRKIEQTMTSLPEATRDPFIGLDRQLQATLALYRFDASGRGLVDWAVAQSGLKDPLSRFTRQELEQLFERWSHERDAHLGRLLSTARHESGMVDRAVASAPRVARDAIKRCMALH
jgi:hypothetical protein